MEVGDHWRRLMMVRIARVRLSTVSPSMITDIPLKIVAAFHIHNGSFMASPLQGQHVAREMSHSACFARLSCKFSRRDAAQRNNRTRATSRNRGIQIRTTVYKGRILPGCSVEPIVTGPAAKYVSRGQLRSVHAHSTQAPFEYSPSRRVRTKW